MPSRSFPPVVSPHVRLLLLGSLPGRISLAEQRYYANPRNQFWSLVGALIDQPLPAMDYEERLATLLAHGIGLWDAIGEARREGSTDAAIRNAVANPLAERVASLPMLRAIAFNGAKSAAVGRRALGQTTDAALIDLPSSSPACTIGFDAKLARWRALTPWLQSGLRKSAQ